ncbi:MAG: M28 family peptidase [Gemmatimonadales bacterium]
MRHLRVLVTGSVLGLVVSLGAVQANAQEPSQPLPLKYVGPPTVPAITAGDLMTRLYKYADDSMMGRDVGTPYHLMATAYIESEVRRLGLVPGGDNGTYFQNIHVLLRGFDTTSTMTINGTTYHGGTDFLASSSGSLRRLEGAKVLVWGGTVLDTLNAPKGADAAGMLVYLHTLMRLPQGFDQAAFVKSQGFQNYQAMTRVAAGFITSAGDSIPPARVAQAIHPPQAAEVLESDKPGLINLVVTSRVLDTILGMPAASAPAGTVGKPVSADLRFTDAALPGRNVVAILPGSDRKLKGEYVAIGAHNDHIGTGCPHGESDSLKIYGAVGHPAGAEGGRDFRANPITSAEWADINAKIADLRKVYPARADSICNGADDDGSGTVSVLEIAEQFAKGNFKPKRSILFVWHAGEEHGMWGSGYFMDHPTVPRDSIVAQLNIDMIGRGAATDVTGQAMEGGVLHGGDRYLQLVGSRRLSTELGDLVESVNKDKGYGINFDYHIDADGHPQNIYCRSDHWSYAKWGVPVVFFTTGGHSDYHQATDEPQYIRYGSMARIDSLIFDIAARVADLDHRVVVDHPKPNPAPATVCKQ